MGDEPRELVLLVPVLYFVVSGCFLSGRGDSAEYWFLLAEPLKGYEMESLWSEDLELVLLCCIGSYYCFAEGIEPGVPLPRWTDSRFELL